jgi:hypothetical protein
MRYETDILRGKHMKVVDAKYTLYPDMDFVTEVKKSNSRRLKLSEQSIAIEPETREARALPQNRAR